MKYKKAKTVGTIYTSSLSTRENNIRIMWIDMVKGYGMIAIIQ